MLSVLIPVYNYNIVDLVEEIHQQLMQCAIAFEIIVIDDCSTEPFSENTKIDTLSHTVFTVLDNNIGRSAIRNLLAKKANYSTLLFVDAGTFPKEENFIASYLNSIHKDVVIGGMMPKEKAPEKPYKLRWLYTKTREASYDSNGENRHVLISSNFLIKKSVIETYPFDESLTTYGNEDVLFFHTLQANEIDLSFINNPVLHAADDDANTYVNKAESTIRNLIFLLEANKLDEKKFKIAVLHSKLKKVMLDKLVLLVFKTTKPILLKNFNSSSPSILLFDFYKLGYYCSYKTKN
ncbi:glycosyltransferase family 2 protein [Aquaticitalea lipolytica]|uniref:glycosyltransferase family 2 protein n=1 Tax=Aquaticitalea lipolytica TaxID=1247562 RepID=UPI0024BA9A7B|nr:glycosyltransferase [Aquaticitalea lipolytica]